MMLKRLAIVLTLVTLALPAHADPVAIGAVKILYGQVTLIRGGKQHSVALGNSIFEGDHLETLVDGHVGITFRDGTRISVGPSSDVELTHVLFAPEQQQYGLVLRLLAGTMDYLSGLTSKLAPDSISIETPTATIAVRGTHLLIRAQG